MALACLNLPRQSGGVLWDTGNAFGFIAFAGILCLIIESGRSNRGKLHKYLSCLTLFAVALHVAVLWLSEDTIWFYVGLHAPAYMYAGLVSLVLMLTTMVLAWPSTRRHWHLEHRNFRNWHNALAVGVLIAALWHMLGSGFYIDAFEGVLLVVFSVVLIFVRQRAASRQPASIYSLSLAWLGAVALFVAVKVQL